MELFKFSKAQDIGFAIKAGALSPTAQQGAAVRYIAGGTTLLDLMKLNVERPAHVIDINGLPLSSIEKCSDGGLKVGALVRNADLAHHPLVSTPYLVLAQALRAGASAQLRNMATTGGNLLQRTRCMYFRNEALPCNKREPGSGCPAIDGENRNLAILGGSEHCIATNPSDMSVALSALEASIHIEGTDGAREITIDDFFLTPGTTPERENVMKPGDLISFITLPPPRPASRQLYLKLRDRASYEFALSSAAIIIEMDQGLVSFARIALGGVGTKPWRSREAEQALLGQKIEPRIFDQAAAAALKDAQAQSQNGFKIELAKRCIIHALKLATTSA